MTEAIFRKRRAAFAGEVGLYPVDEESADLLHGVKDGRDVGCDVKQRRNPRHHRLFFAIIKFVREHSPNMAEVPTDKLVVALKLATGLVDTFIDTETGKTICVPRSISWAAMDQTKFNAFFNEACDVVARRWMPEGTTPDDVRDELIAMVDGPHALQERRA